MKRLRPAHSRHLAAASLALGFAIATAGPAAAQYDWTDLFMNEQKELEVAQQEHPKILGQFGGEYENPALSAYLNGMIQYLGRYSDRPDVHYRVTLLNSPIVNAFALPAGYLYISRGLLALAGNEAEVAGVLAHEIGHVTARHTAQRYSRGVLATGAIAGIGLLGAVLDSPQIAQAAQQIAGVGATLYIRGFSRDQEFEADTLGIQTLARSGYDPFAMSSFLNRLQQQTKLEAQLMGKPGEADQFGLLATHPRTADRVDRAIAGANLPNRSQTLRADPYLRRLEGLLHGDDPEQGYVRGRLFVHPTLKLRFEVPEGFRLLNSEAAVSAIGPDGSNIKFDAAKQPFDGPMSTYITTVWAKDKPPPKVETIDMDGLEAATGAMRLTTQQGGQVDIRLTAIRFDEETIYRFVYATPPHLTDQFDTALQATTDSFRRIDDEEAAEFKPHRLQIVEVAAGDTIQSLAQRLPFADLQVERFATLNGLDPSVPLRPGQLVKLIVEES